jgi:hypothetical protein
VVLRNFAGLIANGLPHFNVGKKVLLTAASSIMLDPKEVL